MPCRAAQQARLVWRTTCARVVGVLMTNSSRLLSKVAVVCISTALFPENIECLPVAALDSMNIGEIHLVELANLEPRILSVKTLESQRS